MARVKSRDTAPELAVRRALHAAGLRYRLHRADLPGKPDIVLPRHAAAVLVHGCSWHSHPGCPRVRVPSTRRDYWVPKLARNAARDRASISTLEGLGWRVHVVWECELRRPGRVAELISAVRERTGG